MSRCGQQLGDDGRYTREVVLFGGDAASPTAADARALAAKLIEAVDAMESLQ